MAYAEIGHSNLTPTVGPISDATLVVRDGCAWADRAVVHAVAGWRSLVRCVCPAAKLSPRRRRNCRSAGGCPLQSLSL